ncbi:uncharacterized protein G2W53_008327 [Senna tora]|uniref:Uncharacterized protein n=1 Tax=Senna tora TaxID=362788 RepID=A0A834X879_9FABA|nr:uncharacterized protein G2W53_008327 [Senna tora]
MGGIGRRMKQQVRRGKKRERK